MSIVVM
jgi:hypothetical protein